VVRCGVDFVESRSVLDWTVLVSLLFVLMIKTAPYGTKTRAVQRSLLCVLSEHYPMKP
jgi:hypothetical protein